MKKVLVMDTSIFCVWLKVPNRETCGPDEDRWDHERVYEKIEEEKADHTTFILPLATIIEKGNHISQAPRDRYGLAQRFCGILMDCLDSKTPWAAFSEQTSLWEEEKMRQLAKDWPNLAAQGISIGDATIKSVAEYYAQSGCEVEIFTGDAGLKAYQPTAPSSFVPRRRK